ncbi:MAG TPA: hypothetical protein EYG03_23730 [Planctomycetes bacterium]|nr:hypothetical protein [Fuerstiella sp.]HIK94967.1 hypothetical protein [Planctomycetota bacterium]
MEDSERSLLIVLCLGVQLSGDETDDEIRTVIEDMSDSAESEKINPLQKELGRWLKVSFAASESRQDASLEMWEKIDRQRYSLADVPAKLRRRAFGGSLQLQQRALRARPFSRLIKKVVAFVRQMIIIAILAAIAWFVWTNLKPS